MIWFNVNIYMKTGVYTRISSVLDWILNTTDIGQTTECGKSSKAGLRFLSEEDIFFSWEKVDLITIINIL